MLIIIFLILALINILFFIMLFSFKAKILSLLQYTVDLNTTLDFNVSESIRLIKEDTKSLIDDIKTVTDKLKADIIDAEIKNIDRILLLIQTSNKEDHNNVLNELKDFKTVVKTFKEQFETKITNNLGKSNDIFNNLSNQLTKIEETQKNMSEISSQVNNLNNILIDKKTRGIFGEKQLYQILAALFGEHNNHLYKMQCSLPNGNIVDAMLLLPPPLENIAIDAKFPLENYKRMTDDTLDSLQRKDAEKLFINNVKQHIKDINLKYTNVNSNYLIMFIPAEAIFAHINSNYQNLLDFAYKHKVWIASPTTLAIILTSIQLMVKNVNYNHYAKELQQQLKELGNEFKRYFDRWSSLEKHITQVSKDVKVVGITSKKLYTQFNRIGEECNTNPRVEGVEGNCES